MNGESGKAPLTIEVETGKPVVLDAAGTTDPDGHAVTYTWVLYSEAGSGIPGQPVFAGPPIPVGGGGNQDEGGIPSAGAGGAPQPPVRVVLDRTTGQKITATLRTPGTGHVILVVEDHGTPRLTSYRRIILKSK